MLSISSFSFPLFLSRLGNGNHKIKKKPSSLPYLCYNVLFWLFRAPKTKGWCILGSCFWITSPWKTCSERLALFFCILHISLFNTVTHRVTTTCLGTCSRTSTICSIWCVPRGPLPVPPNPPAASVTSLRRRWRVSRWVLRLPFSSFHHWFQSFHQPRPCLNTHMHTCLKFVVWRFCEPSQLKTLFIFYFLQPLQNANSPSTGQLSQSSSAGSSDGLRNRSGPFVDHNMYLQYMQT